MVTKMARPKTKPSLTGRDRKEVMNPSRHIRPGRRTGPVITIIPAARVAYPWGFRGLKRR